MNCIVGGGHSTMDSTSATSTEGLQPNAAASLKITLMVG